MAGRDNEDPVGDAEGAELAPWGGDYFAARGFRKLALDLLADAVFEIAKDPDSEDAIEQEIWLKGNSSSAIPAQLCMETLSGTLNVGGLSRLYDMVTTDPRAAAKLMRYAVDNFDRLFDSSEEACSAEHQVAEYRSVARAH